MINLEWMRRYLVVLAFSDLRLLKLTFKNSYETRMGFALLAWRDGVYRLPLGWFQSDLPRMGVTLLVCFSILRFEITKINF